MDSRRYHEIRWNLKNGCVPPFTHGVSTELDGVFAWKRRSGYDAQSHAEDAFARYKRMFGGRLGAKRDESQQRETEIACPLLKWMRALGRPQSDPVR